MIETRRQVLFSVMAVAVAVATPVSMVEAAAPRLGKQGGVVNLKAANGQFLTLKRRGKNWYAERLDKNGKKLKQLPSGKIRLPNGKSMQFDRSGKLVGGGGLAQSFDLTFQLTTDN